MKVTFIAILSVCLINQASSQNEYQSQLYQINETLNSFETKSLQTKNADMSFLNKKLEIVKDFHRLSEEVQMEAIKGNVDKELAAVIAHTCEFGVQRLALLYTYFKFKTDIYKTNYDRTKTIYVSMYLKVKALEKTN